MQIHPAMVKEIEGVQNVGRSAWWDTYIDLRSEEYIRHALEQWWSRDYLRRAIESEEHIVLVAEEQHQITRARCLTIKVPYCGNCMC